MKNPPHKTTRLKLKHNTSTPKRHHEIPKSQKRSQKTPDEYLLFKNVVGMIRV